MLDFVYDYQGGDMFYKFFVFLFMMIATFNKANAFSDVEIYVAIKDENTSLFTEMMAAGIEVDERDIDGNTPLMKASALGKAKFVRYLISMGADVDKRNYAGQTALHSAARAGHNEIIDILVDNGAFVNMPDLDGFTPLMFAVLSEKRFTVEHIVGRGAILEFRNVFGATALDVAKKKRYGNIVKFLENVNKKDENRPNYSWDY